MGNAFRRLTQDTLAGSNRGKIDSIPDLDASRQLDDVDQKRRQAFARLDLLIGKYASELAMDLHWPIMQLDDAIQFLEKAFSITDFVGREDILGDDAASKAELEGRFYRREVPAAFKEAKEAVAMLQTVRAGFGLLAKDTLSQVSIWAPVDLISRAIDVAQPIWKRAFVIDTLHPDANTVRLNTPARPVFCALVELLYQLTTAAPKNRQPAQLVIGLYKDGADVNVLIEMPDVTEYAADWRSRIEIAQTILKDSNGTLEFRENGPETAIAIQLRNNSVR